MNNKGSIPKIFRVYIPNFTEDNMKLPFGSDEISGTPLPRKVTVKSVSSGSVWRMELTTNVESGRVFLRDGWKKIVEDEDLREKMFLVFEFDGSRLFHFCMYEHGSKCKRMRSPMEKEVTQVKREEESDEDDEVIIEEDDESPKIKERGGTSKRRLYPKTDIHKLKEHLDNKLNPAFQIDDMTKERTRIPTKLIKDYNLKFPKLVTVRDKIGKLKRKISFWKNGTVVLSGVGSISRRNHVKAGNKMVCELKMVNGYQGLVREVKIHIIKG